MVKILVNGEPREIAEQTTIASLLNVLNLGEKHVAVEVNLEIVPRLEHAEYELQDGDRLEVVTFVGGG